MIQFDNQKKELNRERALGLNDRNSFSQEKSQLEIKVKMLEEQLVKERVDWENKLSTVRNSHDMDILKLQNQVEDLIQNKAEMDQFKVDKQKLDDRIEQLTKELAKEKKEHIFDVTQAERDKLQATEKLRREMLKQIKMTKASLLSLNDDQL